jgi:hypothetical protein
MRLRVALAAWAIYSLVYPRAVCILVLGPLLAYVISKARL